MPFQSEKQRRYLWANEPEIARDWTDTYGSGIAKALGGRIPFALGTMDETVGTQYETDDNVRTAKVNNSQKTIINNQLRQGKTLQEIFDAAKQFDSFFSGMTKEEFNDYVNEREKIDQTTYGTLAQGNLEGIEGQTAESPLSMKDFSYDQVRESTPVEGIMKAGGYPRETMANWSELDDLEANNYGQGIIKALPQQNKGNWLSQIANFLPFVGKNTRTGAFVRMLRNQLMPDGGITSMFNRPTTPQQQATQRFMQNYNVGRNPQTGRMTSGPFAGRNLPGTSMFGSKTPQQMAQKWVDKYGDKQYTTKKQQQKQQQIKNIATMNLAPPGQNGGGNGGTGGGYSGPGAGVGASGPPGRNYNRGGLAGLWPR